MFKKILDYFRNVYTGYKVTRYPERGYEVHFSINAGFVKVTDEQLYHKYISRDLNQIMDKVKEFERKK